MTTMQKNTIPINLYCMGEGDLNPNNTGLPARLSRTIHKPCHMNNKI
jgi:hypothetical protein